MKILFVIGSILFAGCAHHKPREAFEIHRDWDEVVHPAHAAAASRYVGDGVNCGAHDLRKTPNQDILPPEARLCIREATRQKLSHRYAFVWITGDVLAQTAVVHNAETNNYLHAVLDLSLDGSDWGLQVEKCEKLKIRWQPLFLDFKSCESVDPENWLTD